MTPMSNQLLSDFQANTTASLGNGLHALLINSLDTYFKLLDNALISYQDSRDTLQNMIGMMSKMEGEYLQMQYGILMKDFEIKFNSPAKNDADDIKCKEYIDIPFDESEVKSVLQKAYSANPSGEYSINGISTVVADALCPEERRVLANFSVESIQRYGEQLNWDKDTIENQIFNLSFLRSCALKDGVLPLFYLISYNVLDRLCTSGVHQQARDLSEGLLVCSYDDNLLVLGYLGLVRAYTACHNVVAGLLYANLMMRAFATCKTCSTRVLYEIAWTVLKLFREYRHVSIDVLEALLRCFKSLNVGLYEQHSFYHTYFSVKAIADIKSLDVQNEIADYLNSNREDVIRRGGHSALPWFSLIASISQYQELVSDLKYYMNMFKMMLDTKGNSAMTDLFDNKNLDSHLKEILYKLEETRNIDDFSKDVKPALIIAKRLLASAANSENFEEYVLSMRPKTDFTFIKRSTGSDSLTKKLEIKDVKADEIHIPYLKEEILNDLLCMDPNDGIFWIGLGIDAAYLLTRIRCLNSFQRLEGWGGAYNQGIPNEKVLFVSSIKKEGEPVYYKSKQDYDCEYNSLIEDVSQYRIDVPNIIERALVIKDLEYSGYPTNLIVDSRTNKFLGELVPTANVISTELLIATNCNENLKENFSKSFWMPEETGDMTFYNIRGHIDETLISHNFEINTKLEPDVPLMSDLNVICAHGGSNISLDKYLSTDEHKLKAVNKIIGKGKVLIMFVCYSGTIKHVDYDNAMHSFIKKYLQCGYDAVIAPMWTLSVDIIPKWLPVFMESLESGQLIIDCVYRANMTVKDSYPTPNAWACLHLFGNPYVRVLK